MPDTTAHPAGTFCYLELASPDPAASGRFYTGLFGWDRNDRDLGEFGVYTQFLLGGRVVAAQYRLPDAPAAEGAGSCWYQYVAVDDADAATARAAALGAGIVAGPMDVFDYGRTSVLNDPGGAAFCLWQAKANPGVGVLDEPGAMCWNELVTTDPAGAVAFYSGLFGWGVEEMDTGEPDPYTIWTRDGGRPGGGMAPAASAAGPAASGWLPYIQVTDPDAVAGLAGGLGGGVVVPPADVPGAGRLAVLRDPVGTAVGVYRPRR